jgi:hypothetical protein
VQEAKVRHRYQRSFKIPGRSPEGPAALLGFCADNGAARLVEIGVLLRSLRRKHQDAIALTAEGGAELPAHDCLKDIALRKPP